ncbi:SDR family oxidoreductase [Amycolatopsis eburnea]|uniref:SDR family oxidoreductase n=1 Tax=Amycolatopsis eburnea TaxID=2267691 RepID=A0A427T0M7_9PSEU|nr:SDR family oxidoreductase [Amycolatopsis eburnea]RSD11547.1 SDR family oxidoreductase [Amycolatopsis eburnea]
MSLAGKQVVIIGGGSGIGREVARRAAAAGASVHLGGRTPEKLAAAAGEIGGTWQVVDTTDQDSLAAFFGALDRVDHLFTPGASYTVGPLRELSDSDAASPFVTKFWGQYHAVKHVVPKLAPDASIVLVSGAASVRPPGAAPAYVACNAAVEGLGRGLAVELAPIRVNVVAPGTIDGDLWAARPAAVREASFGQYSRDTLLHRVGKESEVADAVLYLFGSTYTTGSTLYPDGGYALR